MSNINWAAAAVDIVIIIMAVTVSVWQDDPTYLWLLAATLLTGSYALEVKDVH